MKILPIQRFEYTSYTKKLANSKLSSITSRNKDVNIEQLQRKLKDFKWKDLSAKEAPILGFAVGLLSPIPLGCVMGYAAGKLIQIGMKFLHKD
jgi:hypothetical protein